MGKYLAIQNTFLEQYNDDNGCVCLLKKKSFLSFFLVLRQTPGTWPCSQYNVEVLSQDMLTILGQFICDLRPVAQNQNKRFKIGYVGYCTKVGQVGKKCYDPSYHGGSVCKVNLLKTWLNSQIYLISPPISC